MDPNFWFSRWDAGEIGFHQTSVHGRLAQYSARLMTGPKGQSSRPRVLVPLCGKSLDMVHLQKGGFDVVGIELSAVAIRDFYRSTDSTPTQTTLGPLTRWTAGGIDILQGDIFDVGPELLGPVQAAYDRAALVALPPPMRKRYAEHLATLLPTDCPMLLIGFEYPQHMRKGPPFSVPPTEVQSLFAANFEIEPLSDEDVLEQNAKFKGTLDSLREQTYLLTRT